MAARPRRIPSLSTPSCLHQTAPRGQEFSSTRSLAGQQQLQPETETKPYQRTNSQLPYTPPRRISHARPQQRAPFPMRSKRPFLVNDDAQKLNAMYGKLLGGEVELSEDVKWQAVTHKTFDHGRQPYNEKLTFFGKKIMQMHASLLLLNSSVGFGKEKKAELSSYQSLEGIPYLNPEPSVDYGQLDSVTRGNIAGVLGGANLYPVIHNSGLQQVMRWKPAEVGDLARSGEFKITIECLYAIIGAVALQKGGDVAGRLIREKILRIPKSS